MLGYVPNKVSLCSMAWLRPSLPGHKRMAKPVGAERIQAYGGTTSGTYPAVSGLGCLELHLSCARVVQILLKALTHIDQILGFLDGQPNVAELKGFKECVKVSAEF